MLAPEVWSSIIEMLLEDEASYAQTKRNLVPFLFVNRTTCGEALRFVYRDVSVDLFQLRPSLLRMLRRLGQDDYSWLASYVRTFRLSRDPGATMLGGALRVVQRATRSMDRLWRIKLSVRYRIDQLFWIRSVSSFNYLAFTVS